SAGFSIARRHRCQWRNPTVAVRVGASESRTRAGTRDSRRGGPRDCGMPLLHVWGGVSRIRHGSCVGGVAGVYRGRGGDLTGGAASMISAFYHPGFAALIGDHIMPMRKFSLVAEGLSSWRSVRLVQPEPVSEQDLRLVHTPEYIGAVRTGIPRVLAESQKFPWSP